MHLIYCDETNIEENAGDFLIYGGLMVSSSQAHALTAAMEDLRSRLSVPNDYRLKFNPGPDGFSHQQFIDLKQQALELAIAHGAKLLVYVILHDVSSGPDVARRNGINTLCYHFHCVLNRVGGPGLVLIDRFNDEGNRIDAHLRKKFSVGIEGLPRSSGPTRLENIIGFHYSAVGQSHLPGLVDVAVGSLRFAINAHTRSQQQYLASAGNILGILAPMFWRENDGEQIPDIGFTFSPMTVRAPQYHAKYMALKEFLAASGVRTGQTIYNERPY